MAKVVPPAPRARLTETGEALRVVIPARRDFVLSAFFLAVLLSAIKMFGDGAKHRGLVDLMFSGIIAAWGCFFCFWQANGLEEITVSNTSFSVRYALFGVGKTWVFEPGRMRDLCVSSSVCSLINMGGMVRQAWKKRKARMEPYWNLGRPACL